MKELEEAIKQIQKMLDKDTKIFRESKNDEYYLGKVNALNEVMSFLLALKDYSKYLD